MTNRKSNLPILCLDFNGVIHDYKHGWKDGSIYGDVTPGFFDWAEQAAKFFTLVIHSSRAKTPDGRNAIFAWLAEQAQTAEQMSLIGLFDIHSDKPPAFATINDRAIRFNGDWSAPEVYPPEIRAFKPWMSKQT